MALAVAAVVPDQPVPFQTVQRGVDLPDVQRPGGAGAVLKLNPQLVPVTGFVLEQGEETVANGHAAP
ncbi:hypothetical protein D3C84_1272540 [compost metagenome]